MKTKKGDCQSTDGCVNNVLQGEDCQLCDWHCKSSSKEV